MSLLDSLIRDVGHRFGLGNKSSAFVAETARYIFDADQGGLHGFIDRFKNAGLGDVAASWIAKRGQNLTVTGAQLENALGSGLSNRLGSLCSVKGLSVRNALAYTIPKLVDLLTPDGIIPDQIPADVTSFLNSADARFRLTAATGLPAARECCGIGLAGWLLALLWSGLLAYWAFSGPTEVGAPKVAAVPKAAGANALWRATILRPAGPTTAGSSSWSRNNDLPGRPRQPARKQAGCFPGEVRRGPSKLPRTSGRSPGDQALAWDSIATTRSGAS